MYSADYKVAKVWDPPRAAQLAEDRVIFLEAVLADLWGSTDLFYSISTRANGRRYVVTDGGCYDDDCAALFQWLDERHGKQLSTRGLEDGSVVIGEICYRPVDDATRR